MSVLFPEATKAQGNTSVIVVQTVANMAAPDLSTEINAGSSVNVSCFLYGDFSPSITTAKGEAPRRLCTTKVFQQFGNTTYELGDLQYVYDPQAADSVDDNAAKEVLVEDAEVYLIVRRGLSAQNTALAAGQYVDVWKVRLGPQNVGRTGDGEFDEFAISQSVIPITDPELGVQIVA